MKEKPEIVTIGIICGVVDVGNQRGELAVAVHTILFYSVGLDIQQKNRGNIGEPLITHSLSWNELELRSDFGATFGKWSQNSDNPGQ
nr:unnamed protein product [Callosobruchus chinensis]